MQGYFGKFSWVRAKNVGGRAVIQKKNTDGLK